jgi:histidine ammonia-lyase
VAALHAQVRELSAHLERDRQLAADIDGVAAAIRGGSLLAGVEAAAGPLL